MRQDQKERIAALFDPRSIAVIGASDNPRRIGGRPISYLRRHGFQGRIHGVNPKYATVQGQPCVARPADLPEAVDLAIFVLPAEVTIDQFEEMCRRGMKAAVVFASGFAEIGDEGMALQDRLAGLAREHQVALNGPNGLGVVSLPNRLYASFASILATLPESSPGDVAILSQGGGFACNAFAEGVLAGAHFSHVISTGNEAGLDFCDYLEYLAEDRATNTVIGYLEGIRDGQRFCQAAAHLQAVGKSLLVMKTGKSPAGATTVRSHTGLISGSDSAFEAAFARYGVIRLQTMQEVLDCARVFSLPPASGGLGVVSHSGGIAVYVSDTCDELGIPLTKLEPATLARLREVVPKFGIVGNPVDVTAQVVNDPSSLENSLNIMMDDAGTGLVMLFIAGNEDQADRIIDKLSRIQRVRSKPLVVSWWGAPEQVRLQAVAAGLTVFSDPARFLRPLAHRLSKTAPVGASEGSTAPGTAAPLSQGRILEELAPQVRPDQLRLLGGGRLGLDEWSAMALVEAAGIPTPRRWRVSSAEEMERVAASLRYPCVVKLLRPLLAHRARVGAVLTGISSAGELMGAWHQLVAAHRAEVVLVAEQVGPGLELLVGAVRDPVFGQRVVVGAGGVWTNELKDSITLIPPLDPPYVEERLRALRIWPLLRGGAHQPGHAVGRLIDVVRRIAALAWREREVLEEFECNPVVLTKDNAIAVDALGIARE